MTVFKSSRSRIIENIMERNSSPWREGPAQFHGTELKSHLSLCVGKKNAGSLWPSFDGTVMTLDACWSHDQSKLAMTVFVKPNANLGILDLGSKQMHTFEPRGQIDQRSHFTSQCWSQDDRGVVYETEGNVQVDEIGDQNWRILAKGTQ